MEDQNEQNQGNSPEFKRSNKSAMERGMDVKNKAENTKKLWDKVKGMKAFAPLATVMGYIAVALIIIFLVVGFVGFFITMPGLFFNKFIQFCQGFFEDMIGQELIQIGGDEVIDLANYIEDLGYDLEAFGFATGNSITRESSSSDDENKGGRRGKITGIDLSGTGESSYNDAIYTMSFALSEYKRLETTGGAVVYPVGVLSSTNIVKTTKNENGRTDYYKAWDSSKNDIDFFDSNGNAIKYKIIFNSSGSPEFVRASSSDTDTYTYDDLISGKTINGYTVQVDGISVNDYKRLYNNNKLNSNYTLKNQAAYINEYNSFMVANDITTGNDSEMWSTKIAMSRLLGVTVADGQSLQNTAKSYVIYMNTEHPGMTLGEYLVSKITDDNQFDKENLFGHMSRASTENIGETYVDAMIDEATNKNQNLYAYILANERTYSVQNVRPEGWTSGLTFALPLGNIIRNGLSWFDSEKVAKLNFPQNYGMIIFPDGSSSKFEVEIDRQSNTMIIKTKRGNFFEEAVETLTGIRFSYTVDQVKWNMTGWTSRYGKPVELSLALHLSRYGKPVELSLALHLSTMAPDFVYDFCMNKDLQTEVHLKVKEVKYAVTYEYETSNNKRVSKNEIETQVDKFKESIHFVNEDGDLFNEDVYIGGHNIYSTDDYQLEHEKYWKYSGKPFSLDLSQVTDNNYRGNEHIGDYDDRAIEYYPIGVLNDTNIISVTSRDYDGNWLKMRKEDTSVKKKKKIYFQCDNVYVRYYKMVDEEGNPIPVFKDNGDFYNYAIKFKEDGQPYFEESSNPEDDIIRRMILNDKPTNECLKEAASDSTAYFLYNSVWYDQDINTDIFTIKTSPKEFNTINIGKVISFNLMSLRDLKHFFNYVNNHESDYSIVGKGLNTVYSYSQLIFNGHSWSPTQDKGKINKFASAERYKNTLNAYDEFIKEITSKESREDADAYVEEEKDRARGHYLGICKKYGIDFKRIQVG